MVKYDITFSSVSIPSNSGGASITVEEDSNSDGTVDNTDTVTLVNGTTSYQTADVFAGSGQVRADFNLGPPSDITVTPSITGPVDISVPITPPSPPQNLSASVSGDDVTLNWDSGSSGGNISHYDVYRGTTSGSYSQIAQVNSVSTSYTDSDLTGGVTYYYVVDATNSGGTSGDSNEVSVTILAAPSNIQITDSSTEGQLTIDWDPVSNATSYNVYRAQESGTVKSDYTLVAQPSSPPYTDTGLEDGEQYFYRVTSEN